MTRTRQLLGSLLLLTPALAVAETPPPNELDPAIRAPLIGEPGAVHKPELSDREPEDPAEWRPARLPPPRPQARGALNWEALGPAPTESAQVNVPPDDEVTGAVHALAAHPPGVRQQWPAHRTGL